MPVRFPPYRDPMDRGAARVVEPDANRTGRVEIQAWRRSALARSLLLDFEADLRSTPQVDAERAACDIPFEYRRARGEMTTRVFRAVAIV
jgi:hypothetical protein